MREDRIDHFFFDKDTVAFLTTRLNRVLPEILKAFQYRITRYESPRMACSASSGFRWYALNTMSEARFSDAE